MAEYSENKSKGETIKCYCNKCRMDINHTVLMDYYESCCNYGTESRNDHQIIKCAGCDTISFRDDN
jgi:hypothetical protein